MSQSHVVTAECQNCSDPLFTLETWSRAGFGTNSGWSHKEDAVCDNPVLKLGTEKPVEEE